MVTLRSAANTADLLGSHPNSASQSRASTPADSDSDSSEPISYASEPPPSSSAPGTIQSNKTVRRGKDYRPPSTFYQKRVRDMTASEKLCNLATCPKEIHVVQDESIDRGPVPKQSILRENAFIISRAMIPIALQGASYYLFPDYKWPLKLAYPLYWVSFVGFALAVVHRLNHYCVKLGTFDEKNFSRDRTPDKAVDGLAKGITLYMILRTALAFYFHYNKEVNPVFSFNWSYPLRLAAWQLTLDYFFYVYHRASHEVDTLWFIHKHHHTTKHPTAILAILAGDYQECIEIALVPLIATALVPMTFSELYMTMCYTLYVEMLGHSGVRSYWQHPSLWALKYFDMDLIVEDHDLHHRFGKSGKNYGKQSRFWDRIFGTSAERIETYGM